MQKKYIFLITLILGFFLLFFLGDNFSKIASKNISAPNFTLKNLTGKNVSLKSFKGKVVLLNFWATWCYYCNAEIPLINSLYNKYKNKNFVVLGINYLEKPKIINKYLKKKKIGYTILLDTKGTVTDKYEVVGLPTNILIDKNGKIVVYKNVIDKSFEKILLKYLPK